MERLRIAKSCSLQLLRRGEVREQAYPQRPLLFLVDVHPDDQQPIENEAFVLAIPEHGESDVSLSRSKHILCKT